MGERAFTTASTVTDAAGWKRRVSVGRRPRVTVRTVAAKEPMLGTAGEMVGTRKLHPVEALWEGIREIRVSDGWKVCGESV